jgi:2-dehydro-3-deoxy-D-arabinonate dehydratase
MRRLSRWADGDGNVSHGVELAEDGVFRVVEGTSDPLDVLRSGTADVGDERVVPDDPETLELGPGRTLLAPIDPPEVWCSGVTYQRSRDARMEESVVKDVYELVYEAPRPELFLKDAACRRTVRPGAAVGIRSDSDWDVPEPEIGLVLDDDGTILGHTIGNDVSSRAIEGANPLYLSQAKIFAGACAIGPAIAMPSGRQVYDLTLRVTGADGTLLYEDATSTSQMVRSFDSLASWLVRDNPVPAGTVLLTGTGLVPPDSFTLEPGHTVAITVPGIGTLVNGVVSASTLVRHQREGAAA